MQDHAAIGAGESRANPLPEREMGSMQRALSVMRSAAESLALSAALALAPAAAAAQGETIDQALCRMIESAATAHRIPVDFFARLIWQESSFRPGVTSGAGAQGVAQFMPGTAAE